MPLATDILRARRRAEKGSVRWLGKVIASLLFLIVIITGTIILIITLVIANFTAEMPPVEEIERAFGIPGRESFQPLRFYDRSGEILLFEVMHPAAADREWVRINPTAANALPMYIINATVASLDETFWTNPGSNPQVLFQSFIGTLLSRPEDDHMPTITQRLVTTHLLPLSGRERSALEENLRSTLMAVEITRRYSKDRILEWYLNSAYYGNLAYGIDAAALVYFGKHAVDLSEEESAMLVAIPAQPAYNPLDAPEEAMDRQTQVLEMMVELDLIEVSNGDKAFPNPTRVVPIEDDLSIYTSDFVLSIWNSLEDYLGPNAIHRGGLRVVTTLDNDLQLQVTCAAQTHIQRLAGGSDGGVQPAADGSACVAAGLLPPLRPSDAAEDHNLSDVALVVIDPTNGEILSMLGPADVHRPSGSTFMPFIFLTAFAQGYSPGTMVLDIPSTNEAVNGSRSEILENDEMIFHGPVRMRTALANSYIAASTHSLNLIGAESVLRTALPMGIIPNGEVDTGYREQMISGNFNTTLLDLSFAYGVMANRGRMAGGSARSDLRTSETRSLEPVSILWVEDAAGRLIYTHETEERAVLSPQLAYLITDVLSDDAARWPTFGQPNPLEIGSPSGVKTGTSRDQTDNWTIGFTPSRVVGVWVGNLNGEAMKGVNARNGATPIWHAAIRYVTRDVPQEGWVEPPGVTSMEVCDPSGLLPTQYCPNIVREVFINGTEPTHYDNLFQPFLINRETGKLATLFTPLTVMEEKIYMIPPPGASQWAGLSGIEQPPKEYDTLYEQVAINPEVNISSPVPFDILRDQVILRGDARSENFDYFQLQVGEGLNPVSWIKIEGEGSIPVTNGILGNWDTTGLSGLYTLQLMVVQANGQFETAAVHVTIDNVPPEINLLSPQPGEVLDLTGGQEIVIEAEVWDEMSIAKTIFFVDGRELATLTNSPYSIRWRPSLTGDYQVYARAYDTAGNIAKSEQVGFHVVR